MSTIGATELIRLYGTRYLVDTLGFEKHLRQIRAQRGELVPLIWYKRPAMYGLRLEQEKILGTGDTLEIPQFVEKPDYEFEIIGFFTESIKTCDVVSAI